LTAYELNSDVQQVRPQDASAGPVRRLALRMLWRQRQLSAHLQARAAEAEDVRPSRL